MPENDIILAGTWVEVTQIIMPAQKRSETLPIETRRTDLTLKVHGFLIEDAALGSEARILTLAEREITGTLTEIEPRFGHDFGSPVPELLHVGAELRHELRLALQNDKGGQE
jgi:2-amino-4-ketopentanoate thiolase alpha subunit